MTEKAEKPKFYRYAGVVVRLYKGRLTAVRPFGRLVHARKDCFPRYAMSYAPLPEKYRRQIAEAAAEQDRRAQAEREDRERRARLADQGIETPGHKPAPWKDLGSVASGAIA